ncbi:fibroblast growth factor receptor homolog 1 [Teleopsis dalmanni]|uniref:fibroblast growth factor receptor homolog 1 n=1 Tax=Teleopsis dalmanni TaxID=139649 RepID=UPI0018CEB4CC|nr:fibroblast growth factor receptor homolog 1 [Teleopsis dalmanni]
MVRSVPLNSDVEITCRFAKVIWYRNDQLIEANRTLNLRSIQANDIGTYSCYTPIELHGLKWSNLTLKITDPLSTIEDDIADFKLVSYDDTVNIENSEQNQIFDQPSEDEYIHKTVGESVKFSCGEQYNSIYNVTWSLNDTLLDNNDVHYKMSQWSLLVDNLKFVDQGIYKCFLCNKIDCMERVTMLVVHAFNSSAPYVSGALQNQTVNLNEHVTFECEIISDLTPLNFIWVKHQELNIPKVSLEKALLQYQQTLTLSSAFMKLPTNPDSPNILRLGNVQLDDQGWYTCIASNNFGFAKTSAYLSVFATAELHNETIINETLTYVPIAVDKYIPKTKLSKQVLKSNSMEIYNQDIQSTAIDKNDIDSEHHSELDFDAKESTDYSGKESAPEFKKLNQLHPLILKPAGSTVSLACVANGNPLPNITWSCNNTEIIRHIGKVTYKKWSVTMEDVITSDTGAYTCHVCNKLGCRNYTTKLIVTDRLRSKPILSDKFPQNQTALINSSVNFKCVVVSDLEPHIEWIKHTHANRSSTDLAKDIPIISNKENNENKEFIRLPTDADQKHILRLENVTHTDEGWYTCIAANNLGQASASAYLKVVDKLPSREIYTIIRNHPLLITIVAIVVLLLLFFGSIFMVYVLRKLKHEKLLKQRIETVHQWTKKVIIYKPPSSDSGNSCDLQMPVIKIEKQRTTFQTSSNMDSSQAFNEYEFPLDSNWEINRNQLTLSSTLGEGAFGRVVRAEASGLTHAPPNSTTIVAVKMVKEEHTDADMASLVREMEVMKIIGKNVNIINLLGCCSQQGPLWVIVEFAPHGNLKDFLKKNRPISTIGSSSLQRFRSNFEEEKAQLTEKNLISFAFQIARGMEYLASRRCIHRDLAARNVLVSDDYVMKIADFGLARDIQDTDYYRKNTNGRLPIKWMAPESLQEKFYDSQSDVWSYGVLLWEIMTYGEQPYPNIMSAEELYSYLITGQRMEKPPRCSLNIYMLMRQCWHFDSSSRPTFKEIVENLDKILQVANINSNEEYLDLSMPMLETPPSSCDEDDEPETFRETSPLRYQYTYKFNKS